MSSAIIKTGGKQYIVSEGDKIKIEKLNKEEGENVTFEDVLMVEDEDKTEIGTPYLEDKQVKGKVVQNGKRDKIIIFKYKPKERQRKKKGHRQPFTEVEIEKIK